MKKIFVLSMLISFAMICSCQKQDSAAERQLAQRKTELDARENALDEREKALAEREKATAIARPILPRTISPNIQSPGQVRDAGQPKIDPAQARAERDKRLQQLPADIRAIMPNPSGMNAPSEARMQERLAERQRKLEELQKMRSGAAAPPALQASTPPSLATSPGAEATSPSPSPTPQ